MIRSLMNQDWATHFALYYTLLGKLDMSTTQGFVSHVMLSLWHIMA